VSVASGLTLSDIGMKMKLEMMMDDPSLDDADAAGAPLLLGLLVPQAARSRTPEGTRTPGPHFNAFASVYAAALVELNAIGEPAVVCAPG
jgi:hypothetical protein